jgi:2-polyprenyl-3-methyl-5-hydroxy-6-metoxy-1,4-benzoquinol methylase
MRDEVFVNDPGHSAGLERLSSYGPALPLDELVVAVNRVFHSVDAEHYDAHHPEIHQQLVPLWDEMMHQIDRDRQWSILDFGAGTGFAISQALRVLPAQAVREVTCYDLSPEMIVRCRERVLPLFPRARFVSDLAQAPSGIDLLLTNSVVHHLPDLSAVLAQVEPHLAPGAWWVAGHEPSSRFYNNPECLAHLAAYQRRHRWSRFLRPENYLRRMARLGTPDPLRQTASLCVAEGLFTRLPDVETIDRLVDFGVAHSREEVQAGRGLDLDVVAESLRGRWQLVWRRSYSFMGSMFEGDLPAAWRRRSEELRRRFPDDGANICAVWQRVI